MSIADLVRPENVRTDAHYWNTFGHTETEVSARWIVHFLREARPGQGWAPFPMSDLQAFYERGRGGREAFHFNQLLRQGHAALHEGTVTLAPSFVSSLCANPDLIEGPAR